jgi:hypothetical protein
VRSRPPNVKPAARPDPSGPSADRSLGSDRHHGRGSRPEGPDGSGVNGLTPGPLRLLGRALPAGQWPAGEDARLSPSLPIASWLALKWPAVRA